MTMRLPLACKKPAPAHKRQRGQAMIEYIVVLAFSVILLVKPFSLNGNTEQPAITQLSDAIKAYHKSYTYALNVAAIPECDYSLAFDKSLVSSGIDTSSLPPELAHFDPTVTVDRCIDWSNPQVPKVTVSGLPSLGDISSNIKKLIEQGITNMKNEILNPPSLGDLIHFVIPF